MYFDNVVPCTMDANRRHILSILQCAYLFYDYNVKSLTYDVFSVLQYLSEYTHILEFT